MNCIERATPRFQTSWIKAYDPPRAPILTCTAAGAVCLARDCLYLARCTFCSFCRYFLLPSARGLSARSLRVKLGLKREALPVTQTSVNNGPQLQEFSVRSGTFQTPRALESFLAQFFTILRTHYVKNLQPLPTIALKTSPVFRLSHQHQHASYSQQSAMAPSPLAALFTTQYAPVQSAMLAHLDVGQIVALSRTCKVIAPIWKTFISTKFDINRLLGGYFSDPKAFRSLQASHGVLISGNVVRHFFARRTESVHHLHVLVHEHILDCKRI
jgi:hypothetical protein